MSKTLLKVAAGLNFAVGGLVLFLSLFMLNIGFLSILGLGGMFIAFVRLAVGGTFWYSALKSDDEFTKCRGYVLAASIISILTFDFISFILGIIAYSYMDKNASKASNEKVELTAEEKMQRRLKRLLALGCTLVLLAGVIFAVTTWDMLSGMWKTVSLILASLIFYMMSNLSENKFKLKISAVTYYVLANAFIVFAFVSAGYFEVFGNWFSLNGDGSYLYQTIIWLLFGMLTYLALLKYSNENLFYGVFLFTILAVISLFKFMGFGQDVMLFVITACLTLFLLLKSKNSIMEKARRFSKVLIPVEGIVLLSNISNDRIIFNFMSFGILFVVCYYLAIVKKNTFFEIFAPIFSVAAAFSLSVANVNDNRIIFLQLLVITCVIYVLGYLKHNNKCLFNTTTIICDMALLYILFDSLSLNYNYYAVIAGVALLCTSILVSIGDKFSKNHFEILIEPLKVLVLTYAVYKLLYRLDYTENMLFLALAGFILAVVGIFRKDIMKKLYFIFGTIAVLLSMLNTVSDFAPISQALNIVSLTILFVTLSKLQNNVFEKIRYIIFNLILLGFAMFLLNTFGKFELKTIGIIILTLVYTFIFVYANKNDIFRCFTIVALLIPYIVILPISVWNDNINYILYSLPWLALIFVYTRGFLASVDLKKVNIIETVFLTLWYFITESRITLEVAVFIGIISFISVLIGYRNDKWSSLYYTGIVFLIFNTLIQLKEFWTSIPIWAYILIAGLSLIGIVTYKEYKKANGKDIDKVEAEIVEQPQVATYKQNIDKNTVITGSVFYLIMIPILLEIIL